MLKIGVIKDENNFNLFSDISLTACKSNETEKTVYYSTIDKAIEQGMLEEGISEEQILSRQVINNGKIVFFIYQSYPAVGVATLTEQSEGWRWYRSSAFLGFDADSPIMYESFNTKTENGDELVLLLGRVKDSGITAVQIRNKNTNDVKTLPYML
jgi:hypothetical protein